MVRRPSVRDELRSRHSLCASSYCFSVLVAVAADAVLGEAQSPDQAPNTGYSMLDHGYPMKRCAGLLAPVLLVLATPVWAQSTAPVTPPPTAVQQVAQTDLFQVDQRNPVDNSTGAFFNGLPLPNLGYSIRASLLSAYDSNYQRLPEGAPTTNGGSRSSFRFTPTVSGTVNMPVGRQSLFATALIGKDFYTANSNYNRQRLAFSGGANLAAGSSCTGSLTGAWVQAQSNINAQTQIINVPNTQTTTSFGATVGCGGVSGFSPSASYRWAKSTNEDPARAFSNLNSNSYSLSLGYARPTLGVVSLFGTLSNNDYPNQSIGGFTRSVKITNLGLKYTRSLTSRFSADASLSRVGINPDSPLQASSSSFGYLFSLNYTPPTRFSASVNASRNASSSPNTGTALYFVQNAFALDLAYKVNSTLSATLVASTSKRTYEDQLGSNLPIPTNQLQSDRFNRARLSLNWQPIRNTMASFYVSQQNRNAVPDIYNYKDTTAGIVISYGI